MIERILGCFSQADSWITVVTVVYTFITIIVSMIKRAKSWVRRKALKKLLCKENVAIHIPTRKDTSRLKPVIAMEDYNTAEKIRTILNDNLFKAKIKYIPSDGEIEFERDMANVVICGPKNSTTIKQLFDNFEGLNFKEDENGWFFEDVITQSKLYSPQDSKTEQYAFLGKVKQNKHEFILICGIHAIGSDGVAYFLSDRKKLDELLRTVKGKLFWCIINSSYRDYDRQVYDADLTNHIQKL